MDDRFNRMESKIDKLADRLSSIDATLAAQHVSLKHHIKRTNLLEERLSPLERHTSQVSGVLKAIGILATIGAGVEGFVVLLQYLKG